MLKRLSVKIKEQKIKLARLASVLNITRPTLYRYIDLFDQNQKQLGNTLWSIADQLRGAMDADDLRD